MNSRMTRATLVCGLALLLLAGSVALVQADPGVIYVAPGAACGSGYTPCYGNIQVAVDGAASGDEIRVAEGTYTGVSAREGVTQVVYISKTVTIQGGYTTANWTASDPVAHPTTLDAQRQGRVLYITGDISPTIAGLRITGGDASRLGGTYWGADAGGGVHATGDSSTIRDNLVFSNTAVFGGGLNLQYSDASLHGNIITGNTAGSGGGLSLINSSPTLASNTIASNTADIDGGGLWLWYSYGVSLTNNIISGNGASGSGGGIYLFNSPTTLAENTVSGNMANSEGGGLHLSGSAATFDDNTVISNVANRGGGLWLYDSGATLSRNSIISNTASQDGGGLYLFVSPDTLINNVIADNQASAKGSGVYFEGSSPRLLYNTIARNTGGDGSGIYITDSWGTPSMAELTDTILVNHSVGINVTAGSTATLEATLWGADTWANSTDWGGAGTVITCAINIWGNPAFADPAGGDYHIGSTSAAHDAGIDAGVDYDMDGQPRPLDSGYDIGADEYPGVSLEVVKRAQTLIAEAGQTLTYTIAVTNAGLAYATGVVFTDTLDTWQRPVATSPPGGCSVADAGWGGSVICSIGTIATGATARITLTAQVTTTATPGQIVRNTVVVRADQAMDSAQAHAYVPGCHARINDTSTDYPTIQAAVDAAQDGDTVKVAGYCLGVEERAGMRQTAYISKSITLRGGYRTADWTRSDPVANPSTLNALGQGRVLYIKGYIDVTIENLRITGGDAGADNSGGGVCVGQATVAISGTQVFSNAAWSGGGLYLSSANTVRLLDNEISHNSAGGIGGGGGGGLSVSGDAILIDNRITDNRSQANGGGVYSGYGHITLISNTISNNVAGYTTGLRRAVYPHAPLSPMRAGGGVSINDEATLTGNTISGNSAAERGGGVFVFFYTSVALNDNVITGNTTEGGGGGVYVLGIDWSRDLRMRGNVISGNAAQLDGGGAFLAVRDGSATLTNNVVADNQATWRGSGVYVEAPASLLHTTIARNSGGDGVGVYVSTGYNTHGSVALTNTVLVNHPTGIQVTDGCTVTVDRVLWHNTPTTISQQAATTVTVQNQHIGDPAFAADGYHLLPTSAAVDAGVSTDLAADLDGEARPFGSAPDLGADEWATAETTAAPATGATLTATVGGLTTTVTVPPNAVTEAITLRYTALATTTHSTPANLAFAGHAFDLDAYQGGALVPGFTFSLPVIITLHYADGDVADLNEDTLVLEYWDGHGWVDAACGPYDRHPEQNWLAIPICHLSQFALFVETRTDVVLGEPGLSFRYAKMFGETRVPYLADTTHLYHPWGLDVDDSDNIYITDYHGHRLLRFSATGSFQMQIGTAGLCGDEDLLCEPADVVVDPSGNIWVAQLSEHLSKFYPTGVYAGQLGSMWEPGSDNDRFHDPKGVAFDSAGNLYVADTENHRVQVFDSSGAYVATLGVGFCGAGDNEFCYPSGLAVDDDNSVYVADTENHRIQVFDSNLVYSGTLGAGSCGSDNSQFCYPMDVDVDSEGTLYVADADNDRVQIFTAGGTYSSTLGGSCGTANDQLCWPMDVAVDSIGSIYVADTWDNSRVQKYDSSLNYVATFGTTGVPYVTDDYHYKEPHGVTVDSAGNIIFVEYSGHRLIKLNASGVPQFTIGEAGIEGSDNAHFSRPLATALDSDGNIYVVEQGNDRVQVFSSSGTYVDTLGTGEGSGNYQFKSPGGIAVDENGYIYVGDRDNHRVQVYDSNHVYVATLGVTGVCGSDNMHFCRPFGIAVDSAGNIYVADAWNRRVQKFDSSHIWQMTVGTTGEWGDNFGYFSEPRDVAIDAPGNIYVADIWNDRVQVFDGDGAYLTTIGGDWGDNAADIRDANGVDVDPVGNVYVTEGQNHRVQKFAPGVPGWRQVNINGFGNRLNRSILSLEVFQGQLYAGTGNWDWDHGGTQVWRTSDGINWAAVSEVAFGSAYSRTNPAIIDMTVFNGQLYASTGWHEVAGQMWRSPNGTTWEQVEGNGFENVENIAIAAFGIFGDVLYVSTHNTTAGMEIWRSSTGDSDDWTRVVVNGNGDADNIIASALTEFDGYFYAAIENKTDGAEIWRTDNGIIWTQVITGGFGNTDNTDMGALAIFDGHLYVGTRNEAIGPEIYRSANGTTWTQVMSHGFSDADNSKVEMLFTFGSALYASITNNVTGIEIWRSTDGTTWSQCNPDGFGDSNNESTLWSSGTAIFNNHLYIGTSNSANGGEIWKKTVTADFTASPTEGPPPLTVVFTNTSEGMVTQAWWDFGDSQRFTGTLPPAHVYTAAGDYSVSLSVSDGEDTDTLTRPNYIQVRGTEHTAYLPLVLRNWPPIPDIPTLNPIDNSDDNGDYTVSWSAASLATSYVLQEATKATTPIDTDFADLYSGANTSYDVSGRGAARYHYRVKARNTYGDSGWSNVQWVDVLYEAEPNDDALTQANGPIVSGLTYYGRFPSATDTKDYFYLDLSAAHDVELWLTNIPSGHNYDLTLRDGSLNLVKHSGELDAAAEHILAETLPVGRYYIHVSNASGTGSTQWYHLQTVYQ